MTKANVNLEKRAGLNREAAFGFYAGSNADCFNVVSADMVVLEKFENGQPGGFGLFSPTDFLVLFNQSLVALDFDLVWEGPDGGTVVLDTETVGPGSTGELGTNNLLLMVGGKLRLRETSGGVLTPGQVKCVRTTSKYTKNYFQVTETKLVSEYTQPEIPGAYVLNTGLVVANFSPSQTVTLTEWVILPDGTEVPDPPTPVGPQSVFVPPSLPPGVRRKLVADVTPQNMYVLNQGILVVNNNGSPEPVL